MNTTVKIIFLNGVSSAGKSSIAKSLQSILDAAYLHVGIDQFIEMMPEKYIGHPQGINFKTLNTNGYPMVEISTGEVGNKVMNGMRHAIAALAHQGNNLIIDEVIIGNEMEEYTQLLSPFQVFHVGVFADLEAIEERERKRKDRRIGLARWQYNRVHQKKTYDLEVNTTSLSPMDCAELIKRTFNL